MNRLRNFFAWGHGEINFTQSILLVCCLLFLFSAPFYKALFNGGTVSLEYSIYLFMALSAVMLLALSVCSFSRNCPAADGYAFQLAVWMLPLVYVLSFFFAASRFMAAQSIVLHMMYAVFFLAGVNLAGSPWASGMLQKAILLAGHVIVLAGLGNLFFDLHPDSVWMHEGSQQLRLSSVFEYPNTYAAFLTALLFSGNWLLQSAKSRLIAVWHSMMALPVALSFVLTLSRGGLLVLALLTILVLPFMRASRQAVFTVNLLISFAAAFVLSGPVTAFGVKLHRQFTVDAAVQGLTLVAAGSLAAGGFLLLVRRLFAKTAASAEEAAAEGKLKTFALPAALSILAVLSGVLIRFSQPILGILPDNLQRRMEAVNLHQHSILERITFYKDAYKIIRDYPLFGSGGGGWPSLYRTYQSYPYASSETHSLLLQKAVESGIVGSLVYFAFIAAVFYAFIKKQAPRLRSGQGDQRIVFFMLPLAVLMHSLIDFDMSYVYLASVVFLCMGAMSSGGSGYPQQVLQPVRRLLRRKLYPAFLLLAAAVLYTVSIAFLCGDYFFHQALQAKAENRPLEAQLNPIDRAISIIPWHPDYKLLKTGILEEAFDRTQNPLYAREALALAKRLRSEEPHNREAVEAEYNQYLALNDSGHALQLGLNAIKQYPWDIGFYEKGIGLEFELGNRARMSGNRKLRDQYWNEALALYRLVEKMERQAGEISEDPLRIPFHVTNNISLPIGQIEYLRGNYHTAETVLKPAPNPAIQNRLEELSLLWYIAALQKQGRDNAELWKQLQQKDANVDHLLKNLLKITE